MVKVERKGTYQGVPQWGITSSAEITPSRKTAEKWAALENAASRKRESICRTCGAQMIRISTSLAYKCRECDSKCFSKEAQ